MQARAIRLAIVGGTALAIAAITPVDPATAKSPGAEHCYNGICHRVKTISETAAAIGAVERVITSFYGSPDEDAYNPRSETSSGEAFDPKRADNVASPIWPDGTVLLLRNPATAVAAVVRVNNAGPYWPSRKLDASEALAGSLGFRSAGVAKLEAMVLKAPTEEEAAHRHNRRYPTLPGIIGKFESIEQAAQAASLRLGSPQLVKISTGDPPPEPRVDHASRRPAGHRRAQAAGDDDDAPIRHAARRVAERRDPPRPEREPADDEAAQSIRAAVLRGN
ncbi:MAG: hypothetical protein JSS20_19555 [Proteobacteria bacterium]|nr:hypothetical protein [Pseudomonadota bacterium]